VLTVVVLAVATLVVVLLVRSPNTPDTAAPPSQPSTNGVVDPPVQAKPITIGALKPTGNPPSRAGVEAAMAGPLTNKDLAQFNGYVLDPLTGTVLYDKNSDALQTPASTMKLLTGAGVLTTLDPESRLETTVVQGAEPGTVVLVGGGDVTLSARQAGSSTVYDGAPHISQLAQQVLSSGVTPTKIVLDTSRWSGEEMAAGWVAGDIGDQTHAGYITRMSPLMVDGDRLRPNIENSGRSGSPAVTAGKALALALGNGNMPVEAGGKTPEGAKILGKVLSQPVSVLLSQALENSDNVLAEALAREVAIKKGGAGSFEGVVASLQIVLEDLQLDTNGLQIADGSGLSNVDKVPTKLLAQIIAASVTADGPLRDLIVGLPVGGANGTLAGRYIQPTSVGAKGWVRAKTGSLNLTYVLAGLVVTKDNRPLVFAFVNNGVVGDPTRYAQDAVVAALRNCGCS
jgi:serine-type D-Ala-D-Ala carboxypeptidase/endopeptidase (penicillin-binding protein 4)